MISTVLLPPSTFSLVFLLNILSSLLSLPHIYIYIYIYIHIYIYIYIYVMYILIKFFTRAKLATKLARLAARPVVTSYPT